MRCRVGLGMEKRQPSRRHSTGNLILEVTSAGYEDVLSRYLSPRLPSCHDNCKPAAGLLRSTSIKRSTDSVKPINPRSTTKQHNSSLPKPKPPKRQDSNSSDPFYIPSSRITRRYSDVIHPTKDIDVAAALVMTSKNKMDSRPAATLHASKPVIRRGNQTSQPSENKTAGVPRQSEEDLSSQKLKFRQGKLQPEYGNKGVGKLKFRQGKVLDVNQNGEKDDGKSLRRLSSSGDMDLPAPEINSITLKPCDHIEANKVRNTHLNNVIEEAASRLIQTRKTKVQALVGAFELISANEF